MQFKIILFVSRAEISSTINCAAKDLIISRFLYRFFLNGILLDIVIGLKVLYKVEFDNDIVTFETVTIISVVCNKKTRKTTADPARQMDF